MNHRIASYLSSKMLAHNLINQELFEVYVYGLELSLSFVISTFIILLVGVLFNQIVSSVVFLVVFIFIRRFTGGYHATTFLRCQICFVSTFISVLSLSKLLPANIYIVIILPILVGLPLILKYAPIENKYKPLTSKEKIKNKYTGVVVFIVFDLFSLLLHKYNPLNTYIMFYSLLSIIVLIAIPIVKTNSRIK